jgi:hypothetical protein
MLVNAPSASAARAKFARQSAAMIVKTLLMGLTVELSGAHADV